MGRMGGGSTWEDDTRSSVCFHGVGSRDKHVLRIELMYVAEITC